MTPEGLPCEGCGAVNPGNLKEKGGKALCQDHRENIDERIYRLIEYECRSKRIQNPNKAQIARIAEIGEDRASVYVTVWNRRHAAGSLTQINVEGLKDLIDDYVDKNLERILRDNLTCAKELLAEIESENKSKEED
jgi:hypothetical protein